MKAKVLFGSLVWLVLVTVLHLHLNVGWTRAGDSVRRLFGAERTELLVGFLPVT